MQLPELTQKIIALLQPLGPEKVILFGSYTQHGHNLRFPASTPLS